MKTVIRIDEAEIFWQKYRTRDNFYIFIPLYEAIIRKFSGNVADEKNSEQINEP